MGQEQSTLNEPSLGGYHVIQVKSNSIAYNLKIEPYFDFLIGINDFPTTSNLDLNDLLTPFKNSEIMLVFRNIRDMDIRKIKLPSSWNSLGLVVRFCNPSDAFKHVFHVSRVITNSPASNAGISDQDYIFYAKDYKCFNDQESFFDLIKESRDKTITLGVYSTKNNSWRQVQVTPNSNWGNGQKGLLGCDIGMGITHRIPPRSIQERPPGSRDF